jgi:hypothetical protein
MHKIDEIKKLLRRIKGYSIPADRIEAASNLFIKHLSPLLNADSPDLTAVLTRLRTVEEGLFALGAEPVPSLGEAIDAVAAAFPGASFEGVFSKGDFHGPMEFTNKPQLHPAARANSVLPESNSPRPVTEADIGDRFISAFDVDESGRTRIWPCPRPDCGCEWCAKPAMFRCNAPQCR